LLIIPPVGDEAECLIMETMSYPLDNGNQALYHPRIPGHDLTADGIAFIIRDDTDNHLMLNQTDDPLLWPNWTESSRRHHLRSRSRWCRKKTTSSPVNRLRRTWNMSSSIISLMHSRGKPGVFLSDLPLFPPRKGPWHR